MKTLTLIFVAALSLPAGETTTKPDENLVVQEIPSAKVEALRLMERIIDVSTKLLEERQKILAQDLAKRDAFVAKIKGEVGAFEGLCVRPSQPTDGNTVMTVYVTPTRQFRRAEIRGKYLLITEGKEECSMFTLTGTTNSSHVLKMDGAGDVIGGGWRSDREVVGRKP